MSYSDRPSNLEDLIKQINVQMDRQDAQNTLYALVNVGRLLTESIALSEPTTTGTLSSSLTYQFTKSDGTGATNPATFNTSSFIGGP